ncbi:PREDICTED: protein LNK2 [Nelumbo nucifera]|uniref:Protein LNK2 n=2 Tax=Nelumbo nucifera TaxID=4432 RepID=A0A822Z8K0_NELNU|nr:PREDICTED: protein LNK2 [Nelumbo nucifera]DAD42684.1 TPA_asm: hypothetical protein HUJ06_000914 [Nelumbo nucifera]
MFEWNEEELADIIWGDASEDGNQIVPYPKESEEKSVVTFGDDNKQQNEDYSTIKPAEQNISENKNVVPDSKQGSSSDFEKSGLSAPGLDIDSWPDLPLSIGVCNKAYSGIDAQESIGEITNNSERADASQVDNEPELFGTNEDKEKNSFLGYGWDNIGSFDDLDRIFRNDDSIFGRGSLVNADELWPSSTDVISSPGKSFPLSAGSPSSGLGASRNTPEQYGINIEVLPHISESLTHGNEKINDPVACGLQNVHPSEDGIPEKQHSSSADAIVESAGGKRKLSLKEKTTPVATGETAASSSQLASENSAAQNDCADKANRQKRLLKCRVKSEETNGGLTQDLYSAWSPSSNQYPQFGNPFATSSIQTIPSSVLSPQHLLGEPESLRYMHNSNSCFAPGYGYSAQYYPVMPLSQQVHTEGDKHQPVLVSYEYSPRASKQGNSLKKSVDVTANTSTMTPQEKIEKLRRRQQMQAMLAIQKQQQQISHQVSCTNHSIAQSCLQEEQSEDSVATNIVDENIKNSLSLEPSSPVEQDDSNTVPMIINECSLEETILEQFQDVIGKLDIRIRLCIRDSLSRLAQSATQRHGASDTSSTNKSSNDENEVTEKEEINNQSRPTRVADAETETNPIDRTVAHLLFHRPLEIPAKHAQDGEVLKSPVSTKLPSGPKIDDLVNLPVGSLSESSTEKLSISHQGPNSSCALAKPQRGDQFISRPCMNTPEIAPSSEPESGKALEAEASKEGK